MHIYKLVHENQEVVFMTVNVRTMWHDVDSLVNALYSLKQC